MQAEARQWIQEIETTEKRTSEFKLRLSERIAQVRKERGARKREDEQRQDSAATSPTEVHAQTESNAAASSAEGKQENPPIKKNKASRQDSDRMHSQSEHYTDADEGAAGATMGT